MTQGGKNSGINISISGGSGQFGVVSQGDGNTIDNTVSATNGGVDPAQVQALRAELEAVAEANNVSYAEMKAVQAKLAEMEEMAEKDGPVENIAAVAKSLYDNFGWAAKPLGGFLAALI
jgi:hypothetical protein